MEQIEEIVKGRIKAARGRMVTIKVKHISNKLGISPQKTYHKLRRLADKYDLEYAGNGKFRHYKG